MFAVEFERPPGSLAFTIVLLAMCPSHAMEQAFAMFPDFRGRCFHGQAHEAAFVSIDWQVGWTFVIKRRSRPAMLLLDICIRPRAKEGGRG